MKHNMTILQVIPHLNIGGAETSTVEINAALAAAGHRSLIASQGGRLAAQIRKDGGEIIDLPVASKNPLTIWRNISRLADKIKTERVDILHARSRAPAWSCLFAARRAHIPYLATYHSKVPAAPAIKRFYNSVMTRGALTIANSHYTAAMIHERHGTDEQKLRIIPRGCDIDALNPRRIKAAERQKQKQDWGIEKSARVILCPARLTQWKGQSTLIRALHALPQEVKKPYLVFAGSAQGRDEYLTALQNLAKDLGVTDYVYFAGLVSNMPLAYAASDIICLPSREPEPFGRTAIEAQAAARPVIASNIGGFCETINQDETGWLVPPNDPAALSQSLAAALSLDAPARRKIGRQARAHIVDKFSRAKMCAATLAVYQELLAE